MSWIGINDFQSPLFARMGLDARGTPRAANPMREDAEALLTEGTLVIDATHPSVGASRVLNASVAAPWPVEGGDRQKGSARQTTGHSWNLGF